MFVFVAATVTSKDSSAGGDDANESSVEELPKLTDQAPETIIFLSEEGAALIAFHDIVTSLASGNVDQAGCEVLVADQLPAIADSPATIERLAQTVPDEGGRDLFVNEVFAAFDAIGVCTSGGDVRDLDLAQHHSAVTAWLAELGP